MDEKSKTTPVERKLTERQKKFVAEYILLGQQNGAEAARKAGYSEKSARVQASVLLTNPNIIAYKEELIAKAREAGTLPQEGEEEQKRIDDIQDLLEFFSSVRRGEVKDQFGLDAQLKDRINAGKILYDILKEDTRSRTATTANVSGTLIIEPVYGAPSEDSDDGDD